LSDRVQKDTLMAANPKKCGKGPHSSILTDYVPLSEAAKQPNMPSLRTLQRMAAERRLDGLVYLGRRPFLNIPAFLEGLEARLLIAVNERRGRR